MLFLFVILIGFTVIKQISSITNIAIVIEENNKANWPLIEHLNASFFYFKDMYNLDGQIMVTLLTLTENDSRAVFVDKTQKVDYVISLLNNAELQNIVQQVSKQVDMGTIQMQLTPWDGLELESMENSTISRNFVRIAPAVIVFDNILKELFFKLNISEPITVLIDEIYGPVDDQWKEVFGGLPLQITYWVMANVSQGSEVRQQLQSLTTKVVVLVAKTSQIEQFIFHSQDFIETKKLTWIAYSKDTLPFKCEDCLSVDLFWIRTIPRRTVTDLRLLSDFITTEELDIGMNYKIESYEELWASVCFDSMKMSFLYLSATNKTWWDIVPGDIKEQILKLPGNKTLVDVLKYSDLVYEYGPYNTNAGIFKISRVLTLPDANINKYIGNWTFMDGIVPFYDSLGIDVRNLTHYRIVTTVQPPFIQYPSNSNSTFEGYCIDLINLIQAQLSFTYEFYLVPDGMFGSVDNNGNWNGMIGDVVMGTADIALAPLTVMAEREIDVDFTVPYYDLVGITIMMKKSDVEYSLFKFMQVLEWPVWLCIVAAYLFTSFLLWIFDRFSPYSYSNNRERFKDDSDKREFTLKECFWFCLTSLTPQGGGEAPKNISGRLVAATWWLFGFIIIASYTANLAAFLTVSRLEQSITSLDDLSKQYKIEYAPVRGGSTETYFKRMAQIEEILYNIWKAMSLNESMSALDRAQLSVWDYPVSDKYTNMWRYMQESKLMDSTDAAIERILNSDTGFAFIGDAMEIQYAVLTNCKLQQIGTEFSRKPYAIAVQSGSALRDEFSAAILKLLNERQLETLKDKWWNENPNAAKCPSSDDESNGISIQNIGGVFIIISAGILLSFITLVFEYLYYKRKRNHRKQQKPVTDTVTDSVTDTTAETVANTVTLDTNPTLRHNGLHNGNREYYNNYAFQF